MILLAAQLVASFITDKLLSNLRVIQRVIQVFTDITCIIAEMKGIQLNHGFIVIAMSGCLNNHIEKNKRYRNGAKGY